MVSSAKVLGVIIINGMHISTQSRLRLPRDFISEDNVSARVLLTMILFDFIVALLDQSQNMHVRSFIAVYHCTSGMKLNAFSVVRYAQSFQVVIIMRVQVKLAYRPYTIGGAHYVKLYSIKLRMVATNSAIYSHHVPSRCTTLDLVAPLRHPCARLTDLETVLFLATVCTIYIYIYFFLNIRLIVLYIFA